jgi:hypothetical protein
MLVDSIPFHVGDHNLFSINRTPGDDLAIGTADKTLSPKLNAFAACGCFMTNAVRSRDVTTVRNRVTPLNRFPRRILGGTELFFFARMPSDGSWIKNNLRPAQCR